MLVRKGKQWHVYPHKVKYTQHGEEIEQYALPNKQWWIDFADKWEHTEIIGFTEIDLTEEQLARFEEIKDMPEDFNDMYTEYVLTGNISNEIELPANHPFNILKLEKRNKKLESQLLEVQNYIVEKEYQELLNKGGL